MYTYHAAFLMHATIVWPISIKCKCSLWKSWWKILTFMWLCGCRFFNYSVISLRQKCPNTEFFLVRISRIRTEYGKRRTRKNYVLGHISRSVSATPSEFSTIHYFSVMAAFLLLFANDLKFCKLWMCRKRMEFLAQTLTRMFRQTWKTSFKFWATIFGIQSSKLGINKNLFLYFNRGYLYRLFSDKNESRTNDNDLHLTKYFMVQVNYDMIKGLDEELRIQTLNVFTFAVFYSPLLTI